MANPLYYRDFQYICCDVPDRDNLIKDDDDDEGNDCEQSDIVSVVLNMGYVPDEVFSAFNFATGFHKQFKPAMDAYLVKKGKSSIDDKKLKGMEARQSLEAQPKGANKLLSALTKAF